LLNYLIENSDDCDCVIPKHASGVEPLIGMYHKRVLQIVELMIENRDYKLFNLFSKLNARFLNCESLLQQFPNLLFNMNRIEDYEIMLKNSLLK
jgi:molybdenum cofactor guanylyltransferase